MDVVELFIAVSWTKDEGEQRILRCEEKDDRELSECKKTFTVARQREENIDCRSNAYPHGWGCL